MPLLLKMLSQDRKLLSIILLLLLYGRGQGALPLLLDMPRQERKQALIRSLLLSRQVLQLGVHSAPSLRHSQLSEDRELEEGSGEGSTSDQGVRVTADLAVLWSTLLSLLHALVHSPVPPVCPLS